MPSGTPLTPQQKAIILSKQTQQTMFPSMVARELGVSRAAVRNLIAKQGKK